MPLEASVALRLDALEPTDILYLPVKLRVEDSPGLSERRIQHECLALHLDPHRQALDYGHLDFVRIRVRRELLDPELDARRQATDEDLADTLVELVDPDLEIRVGRYLELVDDLLDLLDGLSKLVLVELGDLELLEVLVDERNLLEHVADGLIELCLLYTSPSPRDKRQSRMPSSA